jgi:outer membrane protein TolC
MQLQKLSKTMLMVVLAAITTKSEAQEKHEFSVSQSVDYAVKNSVQVKNALLDVKIQDQTNRELTAAAFPQLNANLGSTYYPNVAVQSFPNFIAQGTYGVLQAEGVKNGSGSTITSPTDYGLIQAQFGTKWVANAGVTLSQILFDGQVFVGLQARETALAFYDKGREVTEENIKANVYKVYYSLIASKTQVTLLDANLDRLAKLQHDTNHV